jgi:uncharacterized membrane protein
MQNMSGGKTALGLDNNVGALVCYLNICLPFGLIYSIIVLVTDKTNKLPRFHAFQSILLSVLGIVFGIVINIISAVAIAAKSGVLSMLVGLIGLVFGLGILILVIIAAVKAFQGQIFKIPVIGNLADQWSN